MVRNSFTKTTFLAGTLKYTNNLTSNSSGDVNFFYILFVIILGR